jgi:hypothetical protein
MKKLVCILFVLFSANFAIAQETIEKEFKVAMGKRLDVDLKTGGAIDISGWDKGLLTVKVYLRGIDREECEVEFTEDPSGVQIYSHYARKRRSHSSDVRLEIKVPNRFDLDLHTMGGGISIAGVEGEINGKTMGGKLQLTGLKGRVDLSTMGGKITIKRASRYVKAHTMGGNITIDAIDGSAQATTMGGDVTVTMVGDPENGNRDVELSSMGGNITLTVPAGLSMKLDIQLAYTKDSDRNYRIVSDFDIQQEVTKDWIYEKGSPRKYIRGTGSIAGGKNKIKIETINGDIYLKKGK